MSKTEETLKDYVRKETLNGYVRPAITVMAMLGIMYGFFVGTISSEVFVPFSTGIVVWWFKARDDKKQS